MRRLISATAVAVLLIVPNAQADQRVVAGPLASGFLTPSVTIQPGEKLSFLNPDVAAHDVTSVEPGLFASKTVGAGSEVPVTGADSLPPGVYEFLCSVHPYMKGTLTVGAGGSGGDHAGHDMKAPKLSVKALDHKLSEVLQAGALNLRTKLDEPATVSAVATAGRTTVAKGRAKLEAGTGSLSARLTASGKRLLRGAHKVELDLTLTAEDASGNAAKSTAAATLR
ncbi:MAG: Cupredoxin-like domain [Solirubrobacterales bacterium]|jgi:plastocyanin|nr:Cupredoxin-like domain [Solirubrobacterales bacterium]